MNALAQIQTGHVSLSPGQLRLVRDTIAKDCNDQEFNLFMEVARGMGLNPFVKQIMPTVFGKRSTNAEKRRMSIIITRDGQRVIASRCGNYRPASEPAKIVYDPDLVGPANPKGIVSATVQLWQSDKAGNWWPVSGEAYWDEFAPLSYPASAYDYVDTGGTWPDGNPKQEKKLKEGAIQTLDQTGNWARMPIVMIVKCAEMAALRAGWPEQFSGVYAEEELHRAQAADVTASEIVAAQEAQRREAVINKMPSLTISFDPSGVLDAVPVDKFADRALEWSRGKTAAEIRAFMDRNRHPLREFWAKSPSDAHGLKAELERRIEAASISEGAEA